MIHGIYIKNRQKDKWHLFSTVKSAEEASTQLELAMTFAKKSGYDNPEVGIKVFESSFYIPQTLKEINKSPPIYN